MSQDILMENKPHFVLELSDDQVFEGLKKAVEDRGEDFIYYDCDPVNFDLEGNPRCIAGYIYAQYSDEIPYYSSKWQQASVNKLILLGYLKLGDRGRVALVTAQHCQDCKYSWGTSVKEAMATVDRVFPLQ